MGRGIRGLRGQEGASAVELAIVMPLLLILAFGIIEFSIALYDKAMITNASREGARAGVLFRTPQLCGADLQGVVASVVNDYCADKMISFGSPLSVNTDLSPSCPDRGEDLTVTVDYTYGWLVLPNFVTSLMGTTTISATSVMRMEE
jgi:Flp pilus assembly protein TadG